MNRLGRLIQFDDRSRNYAIRTITGAKMPRSYTWRCNLWLDQGPDGACVGFGVTHELAARPAEVKGLTYDSAMKIYRMAQKIDPWPGENYEGTSVLAGIKIAQRLGWFDEYRWAFGLDDLILGLGYNGPAVIGVNWYTEMFEPNAAGLIYPTGQIEGGHCVLVRGIDVRRERFLIHNSWGRGWGIDGTCFIRFDDMRRLLQEDGEAVFCLKRHNSPKPL